MDSGATYRTSEHIGKGRFRRKITSLKYKCNKQVKTSSEQLDNRSLELRSKDLKLVCGVLRANKSRKGAQKSR